MHQVFHLLPHLTAVCTTHDFVQAIQHEQAAATEEQAIKKILRGLQCRIAPFQMPGNETSQCPGPWLAYALLRGVRAPVDILAEIAQRD